MLQPKQVPIVSYTTSLTLGDFTCDRGDNKSDRKKPFFKLGKCYSLLPD